MQPAGCAANRSGALMPIPELPAHRLRGAARAAARGAWVLGGLALAAACAPPAAAQAASPYAVLQGRWVRPDGGYTVTIRSADAGGKLDASYANPNPLPFSKAEAKLDGSIVFVFLELQAGGYNGSTYSLRYDAARDALDGVYYQAVAQQKYAVRFLRAGPAAARTR